MMRQMLVAVGVALSSACSVEVELVSDAPPDRTAEVSADTITLSEGVAVAVHCLDGCDGECKAPSLTSDSPSLEVRPLAADPPVVTTRGTADEQLYVLVAREPDNASLLVESECGEVRYAVEILAESSAGGS